MIYFEARYYGDTWGRFTSQDPVVLAMGTPSLKEKIGQELFNFLSNPQSLNSYAYARNNPLRLVDPNGEWFKEVITGKQSWNDFVVEIGDAGNYLYDDSKLAKTIMDHPYATGVVTGVAGGAAAEGGAAAIGAFSEAYLGGAGMGCVAWCGEGQQITNSIPKGINSGLNIGQNFNKLGTVIENTSKKITGFTKHGLDQAITREVSTKTILDTVKNPLVTLRQAGDTTLYLSERAAVVLNEAGKVVTTYGSNLFRDSVKNIIDLVK